MSIDRRRHRQGQAGATIAEFLIALGIAGVILAQVCLLWFYSSRSFAAQMSYADMDQRSQRALDTLTQNIRQCKGVTNFAQTRVTLIDFDDRPVTFAFEQNLLTRTKNGVTKTLLRDCMSGEFAIFQRTPIAGGFEHHPAASPAISKLVEVRWVCGRKLFPAAPTTTETMQSARIALRIK